MIILVTGISGSGKTTMSLKIHECLEGSRYYNADQVRGANNDWDFSGTGRRRQARRMRDKAAAHDKGVVILDFICPTEELRGIVSADFVIWMDTEKNSKYRDTDSIYEPPTKWDVRVQNKKADVYAIIKDLRSKLEDN